MRESKFKLVLEKKIVSVTWDWMKFFKLVFVGTMYFNFGIYELEDVATRFFDFVSSVDITISDR